ncbi:hypothetical protein AVEN_121031-1 [Araneus ventricosus]|uniref:Uncharacterized protein n=1 Tax=Araneus ventricosus TaxID=182803 RepID=A0A4Y2F608_ARAVE|nr:hypothetical protein AVEN_121031-1 [Araneus ventricosus]
MGRRTFLFAPQANINRASFNSRVNQFITGHGSFVTYLHRFGLCSHDRCVRGAKGDPNHYATVCPVTKPFHFAKPSAENLLTWCENIVQDKRSLARLDRWNLSETGRRTFLFAPQANINRASFNSRINQFNTGHGPFLTDLHSLCLCSHDRCVCGAKGDPNHYAAVCPVTKPFHFTKPSAENIPTWCVNVVQDKRSLAQTHEYYEDPS